MGHALIFVIMGLWTVFFGLFLASPPWFEKLLKADYYCFACRKVLDEKELEAAEDRERYQPRQN